MATIFTHAITGLSLGVIFGKPCTRRDALLLGSISAMLPDADVIGYRFGVRYQDLWGHRGISHSIFFAALLSVFLVSLRFRAATRWDRFIIYLYFLCCMTSHGLLDAMTDGGLGVAFLAPFSAERFFLDFRPIPVSPIGVRGFTFDRAREILMVEGKLICLPLLAAALIAAAARGLRARALRLQAQT